ncbi:MAG: glutamine--tRNA ligase/YqeY domain fusion protein [Clostridiales bacterium]|nr:glutamine--tRNA ligase/YqeY domain fusion protein [Clostridiales bacterium]
MDKNNKKGSVEVNIGSNFIHDIIDRHLEEGVYDRVHTRFPPEPNGYLHIGHAKSICLNFGTAAKYNGLCNLRFDDTNPAKEEMEYIESIKEDVSWLGFDWEDRLYYAADYFDEMYEYALILIKKGKAYVDDLSAEEIREYRGTLTEPGKNSPYRDRSVEENLDLFERMKAGEFEDGSRVLRAKIDMASPNMNMRDPVIYRIAHIPHHRTGDKWCIYPMYDYAHPISDALENITHSICTLEFEDHRPLYEWVLNELDLFPNPPVQIEFARLELTNTVMSKRKLRVLVEEGKVEGWDDPRMPTLSGLRRRGYTPASIRDFAERVGVAKNNSVVDVALLEHCLREELNMTAPRAMGVLNPLKLVITNYPKDRVEYMEVENNQSDPSAGTRKVPFSRVLYIEQEDFMENAPRKFFRLTPGKEVRLKNAYIIRCDDVIKDPETGKVLELHCSYDPDTKSGSGSANRKVRGTLHWVSAQHAIPATIRLYDYLFLEDEEGEMEYNSESVKVLKGYVEPSLEGTEAGKRFQFFRQGYFFTDIKDSRPDDLVFNQIVPLKSSYKPNK